MNWWCKEGRAIFAGGLCFSTMSDLLAGPSDACAALPDLDCGGLPEPPPFLSHQAWIERRPILFAMRGQCEPPIE